MSAVKSQSRSNLLGSIQTFRQTGLSDKPHQTFNHQRFGQTPTNTGSLLPSMQQNLRRPCNLSSANHGSYFLGGTRPQQQANQANNNFIFLQSSQDENAVPNISAGSQNQVVTEKEKLESLKCLKVFIPEYTDEQLLTALSQTNWESDKALELMMEETFNQRNSANQKKLTETNHQYSQGRASNQSAQEPVANSFSAQYQVSKPSKRRRQQFDGQQNQSMQSMHSSPIRNNQARPQVSVAAAQISNTSNSSQQSNNQVAAQQSQQTVAPSAAQALSIDLSATRQYGSQVAIKLGNLLHQPGTQEHHHGVIVQALEHYADVASKQHLSTQASQQALVQEKLVNTQRDQSRLAHDNKILRKGFQAMLKKQSEWCKQNEKLETMQRDNELLQIQLNQMTQQTQPNYVYNVASMHNHHDDVA